MTEKQIKQSNEVIAKFMGGNVLKWGNTGIEVWDLKEMPGIQFRLFYHNSWDWLMPVVDKIENLNGQFLRYYKLDNKWYSFFVRSHDNVPLVKGYDSKIESVWEICLFYILHSRLLKEEMYKNDTSRNTSRE